MKTPQLREHHTGIYYTRWRDQGKDTFVYFTADRSASERRYADWLRDVYSPALAGRPTPEPRRLRLVQLSERWLTHIQDTRGPTLMRQYRSCIAHFIDIAGELPASKVTVEDLERHARDLKDQDYAPATVRHCVKALKRMLSWGAGRKRSDGQPLIPPVDLSALHLDRIPRPHPRGVAPHFVREYIKAAAAIDPRLEPWLAIGYLACCRASEVHRLIHKQGSWLQHGIFETANKTAATTGLLRYLILSEEALAYLSRAEPCWDLVTSYTARARDVAFCGHSGAKVLRSWGSTELRRQRTTREDIRLILGHVTPASIDHYVEEDWGNLRALASRLTLRPADASSQETLMEPAI